MNAIDEFFVLDASIDDGDGIHCFVPVTFDDAGEVESLVLGMNYISRDPPSRGVFVGVVHLDGDEACDKWCRENGEELERLRSLS